VIFIISPKWNEKKQIKVAETTPLTIAFSQLL